MKWFDYANPEQANQATFDFQVDWGDGTIVTGINNSNIETEEKSKHQYTNAGTYEVQIKGKYEVLVNNDFMNSNDKLTKVKQWGTTGLKNVGLSGSANLTEIATPTEGSFKDLTAVSFTECTSLKSIPDKLFANCEKTQNFSECFSGCENLTTIGDYVFANCTSVQSFAYCFEKCTNLTTIGDYTFANCINVQNFEGTFYKCSSLISIPENIFTNCTSVISFGVNYEMCITENSSIDTFVGITRYACFEECISLTTIPENLFIDCSNVKDFSRMFAKCISLTSIPENLFSNCKNVECFSACFYDCTNLTGKAPELWLRVPNGEQNGYKGIPYGEVCFYNCANLDNYEQIPDYWRSSKSD